MIDPSKRIKELRQLLGLNMTELAEKANVGQSTLSYIESCDRLPSLDVLDRLCIAFGISLSEFFVEDQPKKDFSPRIKKLITISKDLPPELIDKIINFAELMHSMIDMDILKKELLEHKDD